MFPGTFKQIHEHCTVNVTAQSFHDKDKARDPCKPAWQAWGGEASAEHVAPGLHNVAGMGGEAVEGVDSPGVSLCSVLFCLRVMVC